MLQCGKALQHASRGMPKEGCLFCGQLGET